MICLIEAWTWMDPLARVKYKKMGMRLGTWNVRSRFIENGSKGVRKV
jgi:hypothetical protein